MNKNIVIDTNVIVSAMYSPSGNPAKILTQFFDDEIIIYYSDAILEEYKDVLSRPALKLNAEKKNNFFQILKHTGVVITPSPSTFPMDDESDRVFYDTAKSGEAILIIGNKRHYPDESFIMSPSEYLEFISPKEPLRPVGWSKE